MTLIHAERDGKATWRLLGPNGLPLESFSVFADSLLRKYAFHTRNSYCRNLAVFFDYVFEATAALSLANANEVLTRSLLREVIESYDEYLVLGEASGKRIARLVDASRPSPRHSPATSELMHATLRKFLRLSDQIRREMEELTQLGLRQD
ncbi:MAG: hypothetical protein ACK5YB_16310, partial [Burkholderiales bacterium]